MEHNPFGRTSVLNVQAACKQGRTFLEHLYFTAPYKVMHPFEQKDGGLEVMLMAASAGIMEGDRQDFRFRVGSGARLTFVSQSYDKIHPMKEDCAKRTTSIDVAPGAVFCYNPQPTIPFQGSAFESAMTVHLADASSCFWLSEIFSCGRYARGERFQYRFYHNLVEITRGDRLIYRDNTRFAPARMDMAGLGLYEGYTHLFNLFVTRPKQPNLFVQQVRELLNAQPDCDGAVTELMDGDFALRVLGRRAQQLEIVSQEIHRIFLAANS